VAARAASNGAIPFSFTNRKMFSRTTIASSSRSDHQDEGEHRHAVQREVENHIIPKVEITDAGIATAANHGRSPAPHEGQDDQGSQDAPEDQVHVDLVQGGVDVTGTGPGPP